MKNLSTLTCDVTSDLMILYTSGKASAETRRSIETHLQTCPACATAFGSDLQSKKRTQLPKTPVPAELEDVFDRLKYWASPVWASSFSLLTRWATALDRILRRVKDYPPHT